VTAGSGAAANAIRIATVFPRTAITHVDFFVF